jgi:hypothetical protein
MALYSSDISTLSSRSCLCIVSNQKAISSPFTLLIKRDILIETRWIHLKLIHATVYYYLKNCNALIMLQSFH